MLKLGNSFILCDSKDAKEHVVNSANTDPRNAFEMLEILVGKSKRVEHLSRGVPVSVSDSYGQKTSDCSVEQPHNAHKARTLSRELRPGFCHRAMPSMLPKAPPIPSSRPILVCLFSPLRQSCDPPVIQPFAFGLDFCRFYTLL